MSVARDLLDLSECVVEILVGCAPRVFVTVVTALISFGGPIALVGFVPFMVAVSESSIDARAPRAVVAWSVLAILLGLLIGGCVGSIVAVFEWPHLKVETNLAHVARRLPVLGVYYSVPAGAAVFALVCQIPPFRFGAYDAPAPPDQVLAFGPLASCLVLSGSFAFAPVMIVRGKSLRVALADSLGRAYRKVTLSLVVTFGPLFVVGGAVFSHLVVLEMRRAGSTHLAASDFSETATRLVLIATIIAAPFFAGILKLAAFEVTERESEPA